MAEDLTVLVIGKGAREHVISHVYERSSKVGRVVVAPGNSFIAYKREKEVIVDGDCSLLRPDSLLSVAKRHKPDLIDVAQDDALALGTVDLLQQNGFQVFGPKREVARVEWDKRWSREFMKRHKIPAPKFGYFDSESSAIDYVRFLYGREPRKLVYVKASGLCGGKGALKAESLDGAITNIREMRKFGEAGRVFLVEDGLEGEEFSYYAVSDGRAYRVFKSAQDNKRLLVNDEGPQTGGMGAISPAMVTEPFVDEIEEQLISRAITGMMKEGVPYEGILYVGGIVADGRVVNIEYNARWGDPECQVVLPSVETDYTDIVMASIEGRLDEVQIKKDNRFRVCVVGVAKGYPDDFSCSQGKEIYGIEQAMEFDDVTLFGAGIAVRDGRFYVDGGRLFSVVAEGETILEAKQRAYSAIEYISVDGNHLYYRTDIGSRDVRRFLEERRRL